MMEDMLIFSSDVWLEDNGNGISKEHKALGDHHLKAYHCIVVADTVEQAIGMLSDVDFPDSINLIDYDDDDNIKYNTNRFLKLFPMKLNVTWKSINGPGVWIHRGTDRSFTDYRLVTRTEEWKGWD